MTNGAGKGKLREEIIVKRWLALFYIEKMENVRRKNEV